MIKTGWLTRHERGVLIAALRTYRDNQDRKSRTSTTTDARGHATANEYIASDLLRQLAGR